MFSPLSALEKHSDSIIVFYCLILLQHATLPLRSSGVKSQGNCCLKSCINVLSFIEHCTRKHDEERKRCRLQAIFWHLAFSRFFPKLLMCGVAPLHCPAEIYRASSSLHTAETGQRWSQRTALVVSFLVSRGVSDLRWQCLSRWSVTTALARLFVFSAHQWHLPVVYPTLLTTS